MNLVIFTNARLVEDPTVRYTTGDKPFAIANFRIAVDREYKKDNQQNADFVSCNAIGKTAEFIEKYFKKGTKINVNGRWETNNYTNNEGKKVYTNTCVVNKVEFAESKSSSQNSNPSPAPTDFMSIPDNIAEELPFN